MQTQKQGILPQRDTQAHLSTLNPNMASLSVAAPSSPFLSQGEGAATRRLNMVDEIFTP